MGEHISFTLDVCCTLNSHGRGDQWSPAKNHNVTFPLSYFCVTKSTKSHQRERSPLFENSPCRLAATSANIVPRPSNRSLATATGSKRLSADSDSLLCHVGLWRTSRVEFWVLVWGSACVDGMESACFIFSVGCTWTLLCRGSAPTTTRKVTQKNQKIDNCRCRFFGFITGILSFYLYCSPQK